MIKQRLLGGKKVLSIQLDKNHKITSGSLNLTLEEKRTIKEGDNKGKEIWVITGYYTSIQALLKGYLKKKIRDADTESIEELISEVNKVEEIIRRIK